MKPHSSIQLAPRVAASLPVVAACILALACAEDPAPPFAPSGTGTISGQLFFDADNNGSFSPVGGDTLLGGVKIEIRERGSTVVIATATTDAQGTFSIAGLSPGTHDVFVVRETAVTGSLVFCVNPTRASVFINEQAFVPVVAKLGCVVRINVAEANTVGTTITVAGIVTAGQGTYRGDNVYIQDPTGGMQVFGISSSVGLVRGDSIEVTGTLGTFSGELQVINPQVAANIKHGVAVPAPRQMTTGAIGAAVTAGGAKAADVGRLLIVRRARVGAFTSGGTPPRNASLDDGSGAIELRIDGNVSSSLPTSFFDQAKCYDIVGILGYFNGTPQLKPRDRNDVTEVACS